jgi:hypothetical protein
VSPEDAADLPEGVVRPDLDTRADGVAMPLAAAAEPLPPAAAEPLVTGAGAEPLPSTASWPWAGPGPASAPSATAIAAAGSGSIEPAPKPIRPAPSSSASTVPAAAAAERRGARGLAAALARLADGAPSADVNSTPAATRIWSMMSAFFVRELVSNAIAWAIVRSSSRSLRSSTERSSCCSAAIGYLTRSRHAHG